MPHLEILVEEPSAEAALELLLPRIVGAKVSYRIHVFEGKPDLRRKLPHRLRGYARFLPADWRIVVLVDRDQEDCRTLKDELEKVAQEAGLRTKTRSGAERCQVLNRIAVEELEAWFFGDPDALRAAYPKLSPTLERQRPFRQPDAIRGGTSEALERVLKRMGYHAEGLPKIEVSRRIAGHMDPQRNRSPSFGVFRDGLLEISG